MSYPHGRVVTYKSNVEQDFGAGVGTAWSIQGPSGKVGRIIHVGVHVTETFTADTTAGMFRIGTAADADAYVQLEMATAADTDYFCEADDTNAIIAEAVAADTQLECTQVAPTGGTPAGKGWPVVAIEWYD